MNGPRQLWAIFRLNAERGKHWNSPPIESWRECGLIESPTEESAGAKALRIVGCGPVRVEPVTEFYRPESLI